ncbi:hypothetical protein BOW53_02825 [Solemya pervernicosa gill symbiont]|uniref:Fe-S cluster assembly transcriptional regulator IscR n=2 Tax=Gammaproteobacteria incertae sedis TaxID=118884 RepID=A0A1T2L975_9GAMM|nr:Rrf2 family transcriptional regulator [Candidatus Reidiella endopervernicosa]OOZ41630.1 hypothetical protein BOW53_02825 [Solemya pervernicosa gill symbiont]QKQ28248.1 Rrf2 family transcriptional regulator [Candidatus Reidiella endopervernicosa]
MKLSSKGRYAVTAMMDIAIHDRYGPVTLADISYSQGISLSYLEQLFAKLRKHGLVEGLRGPGGGYRLGRPSSDITIDQIITAVDEKANAARQPTAEGEDLTQTLWNDLSDQIHNFLGTITLAQFVDQPNVQELVKQQEFVQGRMYNYRSSAA